MKKVILNKCFGGFGLSHEAYMLYANKKGIKLFMYRTEYETGKYNKLKVKKGDKVYDYYYFNKDFGNKIDNNCETDGYFVYLNKKYREDLILIKVIEELGDKANGKHAQLEIVEIPEDLEYVIDEYDGIETLHQSVREW